MSFNSVNNNNLLPEEFSLNNSQENTNSGNPQKHLSLAITNRVLNLINTCESSERDIFLTKLVDLKNHIEKCPEDESQLKILNLYQKVILSYPSEIKKIILSTETQTFCSQYLTIDNEENFLKELYVIHPELFKLFVKSCFENEDSNGALVKSLKKAFPEAPEFFYQSISEYFETNSYRLTEELFFIYMALSSFSAKQVFVENLYAIESQSEPFSSLRNFLFSKLVIKYIQQNSESLTPRDLSLNLLNLSLKLNKESNFFLNFMVKATGDYENLKTRYIFATIIFIENLLEKTNKQHVFLLTEFLNKLYDAPDLNSVMNVLKSSLASINFLENHSDILKKNPYLGRFFPDFKESQFADFAKLENEEQVKHIRSEKSLERKFVLFSIYVRDGLKGKDLLNSKKFIYQSQYLLNNISNFIKYQIFNSEINAVQTLLSICSLQAHLNKPEYEDYLKILMNSFHELILHFNNAKETADALQDLRNNLLTLAIQKRVNNPKYSIGSVFPEYLLAPCLKDLEWIFTDLYILSKGDISKSVEAFQRLLAQDDLDNLLVLALKDVGDENFFVTMNAFYLSSEVSDGEKGRFWILVEERKIQGFNLEAFLTTYITQFSPIVCLDLMEYIVEHVEENAYLKIMHSIDSFPGIKDNDLLQKFKKITLDLDFKNELLVYDYLFKKFPILGSLTLLSQFNQKLLNSSEVPDLQILTYRNLFISALKAIVDESIESLILLSQAEVENFYSSFLVVVKHVHTQLDDPRLAEILQEYESKFLDYVVKIDRPFFINLILNQNYHPRLNQYYLFCADIALNNEADLSRKLMKKLFDNLFNDIENPENLERIEKILDNLFSLIPKYATLLTLEQSFQAGLTKYYFLAFDQVFADLENVQMGDRGFRNLFKALSLLYKESLQNNLSLKKLCKNFLNDELIINSFPDLDPSSSENYEWMLAKLNQLLACIKDPSLKKNLNGELEALKRERARILQEKK